MSCGLLTTPATRRLAVAYLVATTPVTRAGLLLLRLHRDAQLMQPGGCLVCWKARPLVQQLKESRERPAMTCGHVRCVRLVRQLRDKQSGLHERAKAGFVAAVEEGARAA
ncbi:hypothetical protein [Pyxidicoccus caerfyrddinensis]|uniref:hypothetical protein n=1 Tax=Pyxidicoccus caerfyrddinensis TaxID=2709663 RepID=UPI0013DD313F|nr:hypothetical protein [Pyxidicoccus caerfyrddinensis]